MSLADSNLKQQRDVPAHRCSDEANILTQETLVDMQQSMPVLEDQHISKDTMVVMVISSPPTIKESPIKKQSKQRKVNKNKYKYRFLETPAREKSIHPNDTRYYRIGNNPHQTLRNTKHSYICMRISMTTSWVSILYKLSHRLYIPLVTRTGPPAKDIVPKSNYEWPHRKHTRGGERTCK